MRLLLDEPVDRAVAAYFPDRFDIKTIGDMGWSGSKYPPAKPGDIYLGRSDPFLPVGPTPSIFASMCSCR